MTLQILNKLTISRLINALFIILIALMIFNPTAKALMIRGLMKVGLFQPDISNNEGAGIDASLPAVIFQKADGQIVNLADQKGKVVFINFWATWCPPCIAEMPAISTLYQKVKNNNKIVFMAVDADGNFARSSIFMSKNGYSLPLYKTNSDVPPQMFGSALPTTIIFDKKGKMVFRHEGMADFNNPKVLAYLLKLAK
ncbi:redoxin domain-containing protein [Mucilaginibacter terrigena]|uniref:Redoxin domain-containing protein n=1 Tax=Mucilaginibacter terrigena TaxID=2492395 RepID=A0A4Q5LIC0_9SPHI|nr:TlpA family protein disulfide reductase [Mucilaginibacter terrigena]RYU87826.1 redoxin domain-containing protein [Mucilaginibacter terrigena]